ncbi:MAG: UvrB/UvrC motif-containing protein [Pirellulales bacterium]
MSKDIGSVLAGWDFDPQNYTVRIVAADGSETTGGRSTGREKIQVRLDLGLMQLDFDGRPDGQRPNGKESHFQDMLDRQREHDAANPDGAPFRLEPADCERLLREGIQYYHRYLAFWHLKLYELCARDTKRNLDLFTFVREFAQSDREKLQFDQYRPYVTMMHTRAVATPLVELRQYDAGIQVVDAGIAKIEQFLEDYRQTQRAEQCYELQFLKRWRDELEHKRSRKSPPPLASGGPEDDDADLAAHDEAGAAEFAPDADPPTAELPRAGRTSRTSKNRPNLLDGLHEQLRLAIAEERYEEAARLRDRITEAQGSRDESSGSAAQD